MHYHLTNSVVPAYGKAGLQFNVAMELFHDSIAAAYRIGLNVICHNEKSYTVTPGLDATWYSNIDVIECDKAECIIEDVPECICGQCHIKPVIEALFSNN